MVTRRCPNCQVTYAAEDYITDFAHRCQSGKAVLDFDDVQLSDSWTEDPMFDADIAGRHVQANPNFQAVANRLFGTTAWMERKLNVDARTVRGQNAATTRTRRHVEFIEDVNG